MENWQALALKKQKVLGIFSEIPEEETKSPKE